MTDDTLLTLREACETLFRGLVKPATLRAEHARGRLVIERIGRRDFVTPAAIQEMRRLCERKKAPASGSARPASTETDGRGLLPGSSETGLALSPQDALRARLLARARSSRTTSPDNTARLAKSGT
jgi:hypothetical protein